MNSAQPVFQTLLLHCVELMSFFYLIEHSDLESGEMC